MRFQMTIGAQLGILISLFIIGACVHKPDTFSMNIVHNEEDVYFALGYVHAQERLFQMEMMRRVASGRLAEILGEKLVKTDKFFHKKYRLENFANNFNLRCRSSALEDFIRHQKPKSQAPIYKWFDKLTTLSRAEG